jgi:hypothetical protein
MGWKKQPPRGDPVASWWDSLDPTGCLPSWLLSLTALVAGAMLLIRTVF